MELKFLWDSPTYCYEKSLSEIAQTTKFTIRNNVLSFQRKRVKNFTKKKKKS